MENKNKKEIHLTKNKHLDIFIVALVLVAAAGSIFMILNILGFFSSVDTYVAIKANVEKGLNYDYDLSLALYFKGSTYAVNNQKSRVTDLYTSTLKEAYLHLDSVEKHIDSPSIADVNYAVGSEVQVDEYIYKTLQEAYSYSNIEENNYSIFAEPLYDEWRKLITFSKQGNNDFDPINSDEERLYINALAEIIKNPDSCKLDFLEDRRIKLTISNEYKEFRETYEIESPIISLNVLENIYKMNAVVDMLEKNGFTDGFISCGYGYGMALKDTPNLNHLLFTKGILNDNFGYITIKGSHSFFGANMFEATSNDYWNYEIKDDGENIYERNLYLDLNSGFPNSFYQSVYLFNESDSMIDTFFEGQKLLTVNSDLKEDEFINNSDLELCLIKKNTSNLINISKILKEKIYLFDSSVYTINIINKEE